MADKFSAFDLLELSLNRLKFKNKFKTDLSLSLQFYHLFKVNIYLNVITSNAFQINS